MQHRIVLRVLVGAFAALGIFTSSASAAFQPGVFSCRASALRVTTPILFTEPEVANPPGAPCANDFHQLAGVGVPGLLQAGLVSALTQSNPQGIPGARSNSAVANATIALGGTTIGVQALSANANAHCVGPNAALSRPQLASSSNVVGIQINGKPLITTSAPLTIPIDGILTLYLNRTIHGPGNTITQRALEVSSPLLGTDVVAGEATADVESCTH
jgi:hypothetical protein